MIAVGLVLALLIGITLGLFGGGGSILTVPIFVYVLGFEPKLAIAMSLLVVGSTSAVGALRHWHSGSIAISKALLFGVVSMTGAYAGARGSRFLEGRQQLLILGVVMIVAAVTMMRSAARDPATVPADVPGDSVTHRSHSPALHLLGFSVGVLTGVIGIGGGFLFVPALVVLGDVPMREAVGTSLLVIALNCASGFAGQHDRHEIPWPFVISFSAVAIAGILAGTRFARFVPQRTLKRGFAALLLVIAVLVLWQNRAKL